MDSRRGQGGQWSDWQWDGDQSRWWRARYDPQGNIEYDFQNPAPVVPAAPRSNVDDLANSLSNVNLGGPEAAYTQDGGAYTYGAPFAGGGIASGSVYSAASMQSQATSSAKAGGRTAEPSGKSKSSRSQREPTKDKSSSSRKQRHKSKKDSQDDYRDDTAASQAGRGQLYNDSAATLSYVSPGQSGSVVADDPFYSVSSSVASEASSTGPQDPYASPYDQHTSETDPRYEGSTVSHQESEASYATVTGRRPRHGYPPEDPSADEQTGSLDHYSTTGTVAEEDEHVRLDDVLSQADAYHTGAPSTSYLGGESSAMGAAPQDYAYPVYETGGGRETPRQSDYQSQTNVSARYGSSRDPDEHDGYTVQHSSRFRPGEVFKIKWCEPKGAAHPRSEVITNHVRLQQDGREFYSGIRRFIVVANDEGHCACVPILTYEHKACTKRGVKPLKHGIVYQTGKKPRMVEGEPKLGFSPVQVNLYERTEKLDKESRVNYAKITTVEHNFRVFMIGSVDPYDFEHTVIPAVDHCWARKQRSSHH